MKHTTLSYSVPGVTLRCEKSLGGKVVARLARLGLLRTNYDYDRTLSLIGKTLALLRLTDSLITLRILARTLTAQRQWNDNA